MQKYYSNLEEEYDATSLSTLGVRDKKILQIRERIEEALSLEEWQLIQGIVLGTLYSNADLCRDMIVWKNECQNSEGTLLHDILSKDDSEVEEEQPSQNSDVPISILQMLVDISPTSLHTPNAEGWLPISDAICQLTLSGKPLGSSLQTIRFLAQADTSRPRQSLQPKAYSPIQVSVWRRDIDITRYLLSYQECRESLLQPLDGHVPVWYASRDGLDETKLQDGEELLTITPFLQLLIEATAEEINRKSAYEDEMPIIVSCCVVGAMHVCDDYLFDKTKCILLAKTKHTNLCCKRHATIKNVQKARSIKRLDS